jgi:hypothetical protein
VQPLTGCASGCAAPRPCQRPARLASCLRCWCCPTQRTNWSLIQCVPACARAQLELDEQPFVRCVEATSAPETSQGTGGATSASAQGGRPRTSTRSSQAVSSQPVHSMSSRPPCCSYSSQGDPRRAVCVPLAGNVVELVCVCVCASSDAFAGQLVAYHPTHMLLCVSTHARARVTCVARVTHCGVPGRLS